MISKAPTRAADSTEAAAASTSNGLALQRGDTIGRYRLEHVLGEGGMGTVWSAHDGQLRREVALKLLRVDKMSDEARARLRQEAKALARFSHPNVVQVYDVGTDEDRLYLSMERIDGPTLREWLKERPRRWREVLRTLVPAARALGAAHAIGMIHRDFKPANLLIGRDGRIRVSDFGLARIVDIEVDPDPSHTAGSSVDVSVPEQSLTDSGVVVGTPAYMAPEQLHGEPTDARTDVFAFCVTLYEGVYGVRPFAGSSHEALLAAIEAGRLTPAPQTRDIPRWLRRAVVRGLEAEPERRWASIDALANELRRRLGRPWHVSVAVGLASVAGLGLAAAMIGDDAPTACAKADTPPTPAWSNANKSAVQRAFADTSVPYAADSWRTVEAVVDDTVSQWATNRVAICRATHVDGTQSEADLDARMACLSRRWADLDALVRVFARADAATVERAARAVRGLQPLSTCNDVERLRTGIEPPPVELVGAVARMRRRISEVEALNVTRRLSEARPLAVSLVRESESLGYAPVRAEALAQLGILHNYLGRYDEALEQLSAAYFLADTVGDAELALRTATSLVAVVGYNLQRTDAAEEWIRSAEMWVERGNLHGRELEAGFLNNLGLAREVQGRLDEAARLHRRALDIRERAGSTPQLMASSWGNLANVAVSQGRIDEALEYHRRSLSLFENDLGPAHPSVGKALFNTALALTNRGDLESALGYHRRAIWTLERALPDTSATLALAQSNFGAALYEAGRWDESLEMLFEAFEARASMFGPGHPETASSIINIGLVFRERDKKRARAFYERALAVSDRAHGKHHVSFAIAQSNLAELDHAEGRLDLALAGFRDSVRSWEQALGPDHPSVAVGLTGVGRVLLDLGRPGEALEALERAITIRGAQRIDLRTRARTEFKLARARYRTDSDGGRAIEMAESVRAELLAADRTYLRLYREVEAWLAEHGGEPRPTSPDRRP